MSTTQQFGRSLRGLRRSAQRARGRGTSAAQRRSRRRRRGRLALIVAACLAVLAGGWLWLRDSPLVAVQHVTVTGVSGSDAGRIRAQLTSAARGMTTLDVRTGTLRAAVSGYPVVKALHVETHFPHGLRIVVSEQLAVASVMLGGHATPVAGDGTVLRDAAGAATLPVLTLKAAPGGARITDPTARLELRLLAAAPYQLLARLASVSDDYWHGLVAQVRSGPSIYFGSGDQLASKWQAATAILAVPSTAGASYIDVTDPRRPAAGAGTTVGAPAPSGGAATSAAASTAASASASTAASQAASPAASSTVTTPGG